MSGGSTAFYLLPFVVTEALAHKKQYAIPAWGCLITAWTNRQSPGALALMPAIVLIR
jgi:hypothetical protein